LEYYKNIASIAKWYSKHPNVLKHYSLKGVSDNDSVNTPLNKLQEIVINDSTGVTKISF